ncbi:MAG: MFS transporter [Acidisphaera sp.]|nr:MFS transporter [Acidisphaera sp.]
MSEISARLERLPITSLHRAAIAALAFAYFFELGDLNTFAYAAPGVIRAWHIPVSAVALITSTSFGGMFIGGTLGGRIADLVGRKRGFIYTILIYTFFSLLNALSWDVFSLAVFRFLTGVGLSGMTVIANSYVSEFFPARARGKYMGLIVTIGLLGIPATAWVARLLVPMADWGWRLVFVWGGCGIFALLLAARMPDSPRWYEHRGRQREAEEILARLERAATTEVGPLAAPAAPVAARPAQPVTNGSYGQMFQGVFLGRTVMLILVWIFQTLGFYGFVAWVPTLLMKQGMSLVESLQYSSLIAICNPIGALIASRLVERFERKWFITVDAVLIATFGLLYGLTFTPVLIVLFGALVVMTIQAMAVALYVYTPELFPTEVRSSGMGLAYGCGRLANVLGPFTVGALFVAAGYLSVFAYIAACWLVVAFVVGVFGPRTTGRSLEALAG